MKLIDQLKYHPDNQPVFEYLEIDLIKGKFSIQPGDQINGYDAGGVIFFREYTKNIPDEAKYILNGYHNLLVNEETGQIIAFHVGRFTFIFRCDFERNKIDDENRIRFQTGETLDGWIDITSLGKDWAILTKFVDECEEQLEWAYAFSKNAQV